MARRDIHHVWGFEQNHANINADFRIFNDAMQFAIALQNADNIDYIQIESPRLNEIRGWKLTQDGWKFQEIEKIED